jgi:hypothetical protein
MISRIALDCTATVPQPHGCVVSTALAGVTIELAARWAG